MEAPPIAAGHRAAPAPPAGPPPAARAESFSPAGPADTQLGAACGAHHLHLRILTFNIWTLPVRLPSEQRRRRIDLVLRELWDARPDIIAIQEAFDPAVRRRLIAALRPAYHASAQALDSRRLCGVLSADVTGGLLVLSRLPILDSRFCEHPLPRRAKLSERLGRKGHLRVTVRTRLGPLDFVNLHLYAGRKRRDSAARLWQLRAFGRHVDSLRGALPLIVAGDFNASPYKNQVITTPEYDLVERRALQDVIPDPVARSRMITYAVPGNRYAALWYMETKSNQRYDYIFYRPAPGSSVTVTGTGRMFDDPGQPCSDHYGFLANLAIDNHEPEPPEKGQGARGHGRLPGHGAVRTGGGPALGAGPRTTSTHVVRD